MERNYKATIILITGWGLFLLCLLLPVLNIRDESYSGFTAGYLAVLTIFDFKFKIEWVQYSISGIGNLVSLLIILSSRVSNIKYMKKIAILFSGFALLSLTYAFQYGLSNLASGYFIWVLSLFTISYSHFITYKSLTKRSSGTNTS